MKILFLAPPDGDYLSYGVLHGLRTLYGADVVDFPRADVLYRDAGAHLTSQLRGGGFTLYGLLDDIPVDRFDIPYKVKYGHYDLIIFGAIQRQLGWFTQFRPWLRPDRTILLDGEDHWAAYPYGGWFWRQPRHWLAPRAHSAFPYFKRELGPATLSYRWFLLLPEWLAARLPLPRNFRPVSFAIPEEKIVESPPAKSQEFQRHIVDPEVASRLPGSSLAHAFDSEAEYYADLRASRWGITAKRGGWDCLRHYEIAASGTVPCFRDLDRKPATCAPHGLDASNSITYRDWDELRAQIDRVSEERYAELQAGALDWARRNTTTARARQILEAVAP